MSTAIACLLIAALLPYLTVAICKTQKGYNNHAPRDWGAQLQGLQRRAFAAHLNHFEAFPAFAAGVLVAGLRGVDETLVARLAAAFIVLRVAYVLAYLADQPLLRSLLWTAAFACPLWLIAAAI